MYVAKILAVVLVVGSIMLWAQAGGGGPPIVRCLPLLGGHSPSWLLDGAGLALLALGVAGFARLRRNDD